MHIDKKIDSALDEINASLEHSFSERVGSSMGIVTHRTWVFRWRDRFIRITYSGVDGYGGDVSESSSVYSDILQWKLIYSYTVENFDNFTDEQIMCWIVEAPKKHNAFVNFFCGHLRYLPTRISNSV